MAECAFLSCEDHRWAEALGRLRHDVYHLPAYSRVCADEAGGVAEAFWVKGPEGELLIPLVVRRLPTQLLPDVAASREDLYDAASPYGYAGPLFGGPGVPAGTTVPREYVRLFVEAARERGLVSAFVRFHPLLPFPFDGLGGGPGEVVEHGLTVFVDLTLPEERLFSDMRKLHRQDVRRLAKEGFSVRMDWDGSAEEVADLYTAAMRRLGATEFYFFSPRYFADLRGSLGESFHLCLVSAPSGEPAACGVFLEYDGCVQAHLMATADRYVGASPGKLAFYEAALWAKARGDRVLHLGGGKGGEQDSLFHFKCGFSKLTAPFRTWRVVTDPGVFGRLIREAGARSGATSSSYFPPYRAGPPSPQAGAPLPQVGAPLPEVGRVAASL